MDIVKLLLVDDEEAVLEASKIYLEKLDQNYQISTAKTVDDAFALLENADSQLSYGQHFNYFSFVTMTTLGYGDITPQTKSAAALCQAQAIIGQFFTVVLIARLVGIQVAQEFSCEKE